MLAIKADLIEDQGEIVKMKMHDLSYFFLVNFF